MVFLGGDKRLVRPFRRQEFWKFIVCIILSVTYGKKGQKLWGETTISVGKKSRTKLHRYVYGNTDDILAGCGVGPNTICIMRIYWAWIQIATAAGGHYRTAFQSHRGVTQGDPLSPTIFNVVVDTVILHWVTVVGVPQKGSGREVLGTSIQDLSSIFYAVDGLIVFLNSAHFQGAFDALTGLFDRVGLQTKEERNRAWHVGHVTPLMYGQRRPTLGK